MNTSSTVSPRRAGDPLPVRRVWAEEGAAVFDFGATYPVGEMRIDAGFLREHADVAGGATLRLFHSLDNAVWTEAGTVSATDGGAAIEKVAGADGAAPADAFPVRLNSALARYVKVAVETAPSGGASVVSGAGVAGALTAPGRVRFAAGTGLAAEPDEAWTALFHRRSGWTGSDGIYATAFDGCDAHGSAKGKKSVFVFGDTFVGEVDAATDERIDPVMINNTLAVLEGDEPDPERIRFVWNESADGKPQSAIVPRTPKALAVEGSYYWLQDCASIGGNFYCFPLIVGPNPDGPEGFQFAVHGIVMVTAPMGEDGPDLSAQRQMDTPLYYTAANGRTTYFGAALFPNTAAAGAPEPDGYVYVYGLQNGGERPKLVAARVAEREIEDLSAWRFWNGAEWTTVKEDVAPVADIVSPELSVSPVTGGWLDGKYVLVFHQPSETGGTVSISTADSPVGPFGEPVRLFACDPFHKDAAVYNYNAKAHPHLSRPGELLASYNVNCTSWDMLMKHASIYRPRFVNIRAIR